MIYHNNVDLQKARGAQIVVAAVKTLDGLTREDYAYRLINEWGVGDKTGNNGVVLLLAIEEDDYYLTTGTGMERHLDAGAAKTMLDKYLEPDFAKKDYDAGIREIFEALFRTRPAGRRLPHRRIRRKPKRRKKRAARQALSSSLPSY